MSNRKCTVTEGCDCRHCKVCGGHCFDDEGEVCDACRIERASGEAEAVTRAFGGNYEKAALFMGW